ncbi:SIS domain-containing protein [Propionibacteriaceae bacterium Y1700]|uniref:SIS domain-containing protein n=1 Tax=Microlunatus sp. Y1700 TaxID=3418487 RepID=UPI003DA6CF7C
MTFHVEEEIQSQPECWARAAELAASVAEVLPSTGERVAFVGCGTSWFMSQAAAVWRESAGLGESDAFTADEFPLGRSYDRVVAITRSGTTTEVLTLLGRLKGKTRTVALTGDLDTPVVDAADDIVDLSFADEKSVVQTRFATTVLALLRTHFGHDAAALVEGARVALTTELTEAMTAAEQVTFVGRGAAFGIANEAALKFRESSSSWAESYPAMDYRHGPISIAAPGRVVWCFGPAPDGLAEQVADTGATFLEHGTDPLVDLVLAQRWAIARAIGLGLNPDQPRSLTRSIVLDG